MNGWLAGYRYSRWNELPNQQNAYFLECCSHRGCVMGIVTNVSNRALQMQRSTMRTWEGMGNFGNAIAASLTQRKTGKVYFLMQKMRVFSSILCKCWFFFIYNKRLVSKIHRKQPKQTTESPENSLVPWHFSSKADLVQR